MKKILWFLTGIVLTGCSPKFNDMATDMPVKAQIDLVNVSNDRIQVAIDPGRFSEETVIFMIPETVPGTYSTDNYGQYIEDIQALDYKGRPLSVEQLGVNRWAITPGKNLDRITYYVNDTFDTEYQTDSPVFSPAGTNIEKGENYFLNLHMLVGYFNGYDRRPYELEFIKPEGFEAATSLIASKKEKSGSDYFYASRYFEVTDNPVMYAKPDSERFMVNDIEVTLSVYSPSKVYSALSLKTEMETMMKAQKRFLGPLDGTKKYHILLFLSDMEQGAPQGFGALEHHTSTTVVMPESMPKPMLAQSMIDVVSHEFFHIVTPLSIHSEEVHYFNYNDPEMSQHLWMYEGVTEYFAQLFQINQELIGESEFYDRIYQKIQNAKRYDDTMSFTEMSANILKAPYKDNYGNVYEKGALIAMCMDIIIREESGGERGILSLMKALAEHYGTDKPFKDDALFEKIESLTYPEVGRFIKTYVQGDTPIPYETFLNKVGLTLTETTITTPSYLFKTEEEPFVDARSTGEIFVRDIPLSSFYTTLGLMPGDVIKEINGVQYNLDNAQQLIMTSFSWEPNDILNIRIERDNKPMELNGKVTPPVLQTMKIIPMDDPGAEIITLRQSWLKE